MIRKREKRKNIQGKYVFAWDEGNETNEYEMNATDDVGASTLGRMLA